MAQKLRIRTIRFKAGSKPDADPLEILSPNVTVLVGPNNSGKSQTLREIEEWCLGKNPEFTVIDQLEMAWPDTVEDFEAMIHQHDAAPPENQTAQVDHFWVARPIVRSGEDGIHEQINGPAARNWFENKSVRQLLSVFVRLFTLRLDGRTRFDLVEAKETGPLESHPKNHLWALFVNDERREKVRAFTEEAFGKHFTIDPTGMQTFRVRLSDTKPDSKTVEQGLDQTSRDFHRGAPLVSELGDGLRTSIGLVSAVMSLPHRILLIDEPEAFLHPTLARRVGKILAATARERDASLVVATHSSEFLMGCIQSAPELRLARLTYAKGLATARSIEPSEVTTLMHNPLLRSSNALRALFHRGAVITEADADRAFYDEINTRLLQHSRGCEDTLFMNAQNWQTIPRLVVPLRKLGIPAAAIFDFDVLMQKDFKHIWPLLYADDGRLGEFQERRNRVKKLMEGVGAGECKKSGILAFEEKDRTEIASLIADLKRFGLFFVTVGELECWLSKLGVTKTADKPAWLTSIFMKLGDDPAADAYVTPEGDDVWTFIDEINTWIDNPQRDGIPN